MLFPCVNMDHPVFICSAALCLLTVFEFSLGAVDTLSPNEVLADGEVLTSPGQKFMLGFFSPGKSTYRYLGIWYTATPDVVVWLANRNDPIKDSTGVLTLSQNGTLVLSSADTAKIWSFGSSRPAARPALQLLITGNLVLVYDSKNIWQSFDYPTDHFYPGIGITHDPDTGEGKSLTSWTSADDPSCGDYNQRIENNGLSQNLISKATIKASRYVFWNGYFTGLPEIPHPAWEFKLVSNKGRLISNSHSFYEEIDIRLTMNYTGVVQFYTMNKQKDGWILMFTLPRDKCDNYGHCGNNSICRIYKTPECECLSRFKPTVEKEWRMFNWESGCTRILPLDCHKEDGFLKVEGIKLPDSLNFQLKMNTSIDECHDVCLKNCDCTAYADPYFSNGSSCLMWFGDLIDIREHTEEARDGPSLYLRMPLFSFAAIAAATKNFSGENLIGEGGFGPV